MCVCVHDEVDERHLRDDLTAHELSSSATFHLLKRNTRPTTVFLVILIHTFVGRHLQNCILFIAVSSNVEIIILPPFSLENTMYKNHDRRVNWNVP